MTEIFEHRNSQAKFPAVRITQVLQAGISLRSEAGVWCPGGSARALPVPAGSQTQITRSSQVQAGLCAGTELLVPG